MMSPQERFQVKNPPSAYIQKLKAVLDQGGGRKVRIRSSASLCRYMTCVFKDV